MVEMTPLPVICLIFGPNETKSFQRSRMKKANAFNAQHVETQPTSSMMLNLGFFGTAINPKYPKIVILMGGILLYPQGW